jgi:hypothetical protein
VIERTFAWLRSLRRLRPPTSSFSGDRYKVTWRTAID